MNETAIWMNQWIERMMNGSANYTKDEWKNDLDSEWINQWIEWMMIRSAKLIKDDWISK